MIETNPHLPGGSPFPTLWWLTCRTLASAIGRLESGGWMAELNRRLADEPAMREELARSTEGYLAHRDRLEVLAGRSHPGGGPDRVKCLHAHAAHQLAAGDNPVGRAVLDELGWQDPQHPCV